METSCREFQSTTCYLIAEGIFRTFQIPENMSRENLDRWMVWLKRGWTSAREGDGYEPKNLLRSVLVEFQKEKTAWWEILPEEKTPEDVARFTEMDEASNEWVEAWLGRHPRWAALSSNSGPLGQMSGLPENVRGARRLSRPGCRQKIRAGVSAAEMVSTIEAIPF